MNHLIVDRIGIIAGVIVAAIFCLFLAALIFYARRPNRADRALALVFVGWFLVCVSALTRYLLDVTFFPYYTAAQWAVMSLLELVAGVFLVRELTGRDVIVPNLALERACDDYQSHRRQDAIDDADVNVDSSEGEDRKTVG